MVCFRIRKKLFSSTLQECHGIGSKIALHILNNLSLGDDLFGYFTGKKSVFESITGVGKKNQNLLLFVEIKDL